MLVVILIFTIFNSVIFCLLSGIFAWSIVSDLKKSKEKRAAQVAALEEAKMRNSRNNSGSN